MMRDKPKFENRDLFNKVVKHNATSRFVGKMRCIYDFSLSKRWQPLHQWNLCWWNGCCVVIEFWNRAQMSKRLMIMWYSHIAGTALTWGEEIMGVYYFKFNLQSRWMWWNDVVRNVDGQFACLSSYLGHLW